MTVCVGVSERCVALAVLLTVLLPCTGSSAGKWLLGAVVGPDSGGECGIVEGMTSDQIKFHRQPVVPLHALCTGLVDRLCKIIAAFEEGIELDQGDAELVRRIVDSVEVRR